MNLLIFTDDSAVAVTIETIESVQLYMYNWFSQVTK